MWAWQSRVGSRSWRLLMGGPTREFVQSPLDKVLNSIIKIVVGWPGSRVDCVRVHSSLDCGRTAFDIAFVGRQLSSARCVPDIAAARAPSSSGTSA